MQTQRLPLERLACSNHECKSYGKAGLDNLYVRKRYGKDKLRLLRCRHCKMEFGERRNTPLLNCKYPKPKPPLLPKRLPKATRPKELPAWSRSRPRQSGV